MIEQRAKVLEMAACIPDTLSNVRRPRYNEVDVQKEKYASTEGDAAIDLPMESL